jgi:hypothetical protein
VTKHRIRKPKTHSRAIVAISIVAICAIGYVTVQAIGQSGRDTTSDLGVFYCNPYSEAPAEAKWVFTTRPEQTEARFNTILDHAGMIWYFSSLTTGDVINTMEEEYVNIDTSRLHGILFVSEEFYRTHVQFADDVNVDWFGETLRGYPLYTVDHPGASREAWLDEMYLRMARGFYTYFHAKGVAVGVTISDSVMMPQSALLEHYGRPAFDYMTATFEFVVLYSYTWDLEQFNVQTKAYFTLIDQFFGRMQKFWIVSKPWDSTVSMWEREITAMEIKYCLDRGIELVQVHEPAPDTRDFDYSWGLLIASLSLYNTVPFHEDYVQGMNALTGFNGYTYGWVITNE